MLSVEDVEEIQRRLVACDHVIPRAGAKALDPFACGDPLPILLEVIESLATYTKTLEKFAERKAQSEVMGLYVKKRGC